MKYIARILDRTDAGEECDKQPVQEENTEGIYIYRASEVQSAFMEASDYFRKEWEQAECSKEEKQRYYTLSKLGLKQSVSIKEVEGKVKLVERKKCFEWFSAHFPGCSFIPINEFKELLKKFGLVCGRIKSYRGYIPDEKLAEVKDLRETLSAIKDGNKYSNKKEDGNCFEITTGFLKHPAYTDNDCYMKNASIFPFDMKSPSLYYSIHKDKLDEMDLLIAASGDDIENNFNYKHCCGGAFIFQLCPYGVVIFNMWEEREKYEK